MRVARRELITAGILACRHRLEAAGFTWHEPNIFTLPLAPHLFGWVGLGRAVHNGNGSMVVTPFVGLLHQDVERLVAACARLPYHCYYPATAQMGIRLLAPEMTTGDVSFRPGEAVDEAADQVCRPIQEYGLPWMREHASLAGIHALDHSEQYRITLSTWRRAVIAYMLGSPDLARRHLSDTLARIEQEGRPDASGVIEVQRRFAAALEERMACAPWNP